jgi:hypothetical protein
VIVRLDPSCDLIDTLLRIFWFANPKSKISTSTNNKKNITMAYYFPECDGFMHQCPQFEDATGRCCYYSDSSSSMSDDASFFSQQEQRSTEASPPPEPPTNVNEEEDSDIADFLEMLKNPPSPLPVMSLPTPTLLLLEEISAPPRDDRVDNFSLLDCGDYSEYVSINTTDASSPTTPLTTNSSIANDIQAIISPGTTKPLSGDSFSLFCHDEDIDTIMKNLPASRYSSTASRIVPFTPRDMNPVDAHPDMNRRYISSANMQVSIVMNNNNNNLDGDEKEEERPSLTHIPRYYRRRHRQSASPAVASRASISDDGKLVANSLYGKYLPLHQGKLSANSIYGKTFIVA